MKKPEPPPPPSPGPPPIKTQIECFWQFVEIRDDDECWPWIGYRLPGGYGQFGRNTLAHRYSYRIHRGPPQGIVRHTCDHPWCVNPCHLRDGTQAENQADMAHKGRSARGERSATARLTAQDVIEIRRSTSSCRALAEQYGVTNQQISKIRRREQWSHV